MTRMRRCLHAFALAGLAASAIVAASPVAAQAIVSTSSRPGPVTGERGGSDAFIWQLITTQIAVPAQAGRPTPAMFEVWASDQDIFVAPNQQPHFPTLNEPHKFQMSVLGRATGVGMSASPCQAPDSVPNNPLAGGFPTTGPLPCIDEEVKRNRPEYDYIVNNSLYRKSQLATAYASSVKVDMPTTSISVKGDWIPVGTLIRWIPSLGSATNVEAAYLTTTVNGVEYALVSLHIASKQNANWVWGTLEHQYTPGRCDYIGCYDRFGALDPAVPPNRRAYNTQYGECKKTPQLRATMKRNGLSPVWENYCLKGSQVDFTAIGQLPSSLANSVTEGINAGISVVAGSCITCHSYAAFGNQGTATAGALGMLNFNPTGNPVPGVLAAASQYDFMWGFLNAQ